MLTQNNLISASDEKECINGCGRLPLGFLIYSLYWIVWLLSTDADDHVRPQRQLEQLLSGAGAADPLHGAETGRAEPLFPSDIWAALSGPAASQPGDQVEEEHGRVTDLKTRNQPAKNARFWIFYFFLQVTWFQTQSEIIISSVSIRIHTRLQILCSQSCSRL